MSISNGLRHMATLATLAAALGGCGEDGGRDRGEFERASSSSQTNAGRIAGLGLELLLEISGDHVEGFLAGSLGEVLGGDEDLLLDLSEQSLGDARTILTEVVDPQGWETEELTLESEIGFIQGYRRFRCEDEPCPWHANYLDDEEEIMEHVEHLNTAWDFFASQQGVERKLSSVSRMLVIAPLQMLLLDEIVALRHVREVDPAEAIQSFGSAACTYSDALIEYKAEFDARAATYGDVTTKTISNECVPSPEGDRCTHEQRVCFSTPRGGNECKTRIKEYGAWGNGRWDRPRLVAQMKNLRSKWMQEDFDVLLGGESFGDLLVTLKTMCVPEFEPSCIGSCGGQDATGACYCDTVCLSHGDCCTDFEAVCQ